VFRLDIGDGIELRLFEERHAQALFSVTERNRSRLRQWLPWLDQTRSAADVQTFIRSALDQFASNLGFHAGIWVQGELAGAVGLHRIEWADRLTSIGYWVDAAQEGKGLITRSCRAVIDHAFKDLKLNRLEIRCATGNHRSRAVPERLAFHCEGVLRQAEWLYDHYVDLYLYSMLASDWRP